MSAIHGRLKKNLKHLRKWAKRNNLDAFRLYDKDIPEFPFIIDVYGDKAVVWERFKEIDKDPKKESNKIELYSALEELGYPEDRLVVKERFKQKGSTQYTKIEKSNEFVEVYENQLKFRVNLKDYLDTGLFLDHRPLRQMLTELDKGARVLNLFSYTCSLGLAAASAGAITTNVDLSSNYLDWGKENYKLNEIDPNRHQFISADILDFIKTHPAQYDLILIDPPTFSNSKKMEQDWEVQKDHGWMLRKTAKCLAPGGMIIFSNNKRDFKIDESELSQFEVEDISLSTIPEDFRDKKVHKCFTIRGL